MIEMVNREEQVLEILRQSNRLSVNEVAKTFSISEPSARRLCKKLADEGKVIRIHGGIRKLEPDLPASSISITRLKRNVWKKRWPLRGTPFL